MCFHTERSHPNDCWRIQPAGCKTLKRFFFFLRGSSGKDYWENDTRGSSLAPGVETQQLLFPSVLFRWALSTNLSSGVSSSPWRGELDINWNRNLISLRYKSQHTECAALHLQNTVSTKRLLTEVLLSFSELFLYSIPRSAPLEDDTSWRSRGLSALHSTGSLCSTTTFLFFLQGLGFPSQASLPLLRLGHSKLHWWLCGLV